MSLTPRSVLFPTTITTIIDVTAIEAAIETALHQAAEAQTVDAWITLPGDPPLVRDLDRAEPWSTALRLLREAGYERVAVDGRSGQVHVTGLRSEEEGAMRPRASRRE